MRAGVFFLGKMECSFVYLSGFCLESYLPRNVGKEVVFSLPLRVWFRDHDLRGVEAGLPVFYLGQHLMCVCESFCVYVCLNACVCLSLLVEVRLPVFYLG
jgi:hypothetical protein